MTDIFKEVELREMEKEKEQAEEEGKEYKAIGIKKSFTNTWWLELEESEPGYWKVGVKKGPLEEYEEVTDSMGFGDAAEYFLDLFYKYNFKGGPPQLRDDIKLPLGN